jgi:hypothetical protein
MSYNPITKVTKQDSQNRQWIRDDILDYMTCTRWIRDDILDYMTYTRWIRDDILDYMTYKFGFPTF